MRVEDRREKEGGGGGGGVGLIAVGVGGEEVVAIFIHFDRVYLTFIILC